MKFYMLIFVIWILSNAACSWNNNKNDATILRPVRVAEVASLKVLDRVYTGAVEAEEFTDLSFRMGGPLIRLDVEEGQSVRKGKQIAEIDPLDYQSRYEANRAAYITARSQLERDQKLLSMEAISVQEYEISRANFVKARSAYLVSGNNLRDTRLIAPFDGFVEKKYVENYQKVQAGEAIVRLVNPERLAVRFTLPETSVDLLKTPVNVAVEFDTYRGRWFEARLKEYIDASPEGGGIPVKVTIDDSLFYRERPTIYPGFSARVRFQVPREISDCYMVPLNALFEDLETGRVSVWIYRSPSSTVERQAVEIGQLFGKDKILIKKGLNAEDLIVIDGVDYLTNGQKVRDLKDSLPSVDFSGHY